MRTSKVMVAFVAEFSRGKSELINAIFFAGYGRRIMPASAGRTTMCPTELGYDAGAAAQPAPAADRDPAGAAFADPLARRARRAGPRSPSTSSNAEQLAQTMSKVAEVRWVPLDEARALGFWSDDDARRQPGARCRWPRRDPALAPCGAEHAASAAGAGPGDPRHARPERDRRRARTDGEPDSAGACGRLHPGRRHRRDALRPVDLARAPDHRGRRRARRASWCSTRSTRCGTS